MSSENPREPEHLPAMVHASVPATPLPPSQPDLAAFAEDGVQGGGAGAAIRRYLGAVLRYKWLVLGLVVVGTAAGVLVSRRMEPVYSAQVMIWVETTQRADLERGPIQTGQLLESSAWMDLLRSYTVLDYVVMEHRLYLWTKVPGDSVIFRGFALKEPYRPGSYRLTVAQDGRSVVLSTPDGVPLQEARVGEAIGQEFGFEWVPDAAQLHPGRVIDFAIRHPREAARRLAEQIRAQMPRDRGNFMRLELMGPDPERVTTILNAVADRYVELAAELKGLKLNEYAKILNEQLNYAEENLRTAEIELESFRVKTITLPTERATPVAPGIAETRDPAFSNFFSMKIEQEQLRRDREAIEAALRPAADSTLLTAGLEYIASVQQSSELMSALRVLAERRAELRSMRMQYTDDYPPVRRLIGEVEELERVTIPALARELIGQLAAREARIDALIASAATELEQIPPRQLEEARLTRRVAIAENLYTTLRQRYEVAKLAAASSVPDVRILDRAMVPQRPIEDQRQQIVLLAFMGSLGLGLAGAILIDRFDRRFRYPEQVTHGMRLPILGAIPYVKGQNGKRNQESTFQVIEAFRELRLSVVHAHGSAGTVLFTITSPGSGDGKSFVSANLALSFAEQGQRTLLIDGDVRRGGQHRLFNCNRKPGLTDLLAGDATLDQVVQQTAYANLHLIGSGTRRQAAPELLGSPAMADVMRTLRSRYGVIVIDSPPLGAGVDPYILGTLAGNLLVVLRTGYTDREFAEAKLDLMDRLPVRILGAVLNAVPAQGVYRYYSYLPGYESHEEEARGVVRRLPGF